MIADQRSLTEHSSYTNAYLNIISMTPNFFHILKNKKYS